MCGTFTFGQYKEIVKELGLKAVQEFLNERFNIRPTHYIPVALNNLTEYPRK